MNPLVVGFGGIVLLLLLFALGVPIGFAMGIAGIIGFAYAVSPSAALHLVSADLFTNFNSYSLSVLPMFILMGSMAFASGIGSKAYNVAYVLMGRLRGGLIIATTVACAIFGALTGSGAATNVAIGKTAIPEFKKHNYDPAISLGALACAGTLGFMIPPSIPLAIYGILTELSIGKLFIAGVIPGIIITSLFILTAIIICWVKPELGPPGESTTWKQKLRALLGLTDALILFLLVIGGLFAGFFSPTMAGAIGAAGAIIIGVVRRELTWRKFVAGLEDALRLSCMIFVLVVGAIIFGHFIVGTGLSNSLVTWASGLTPLSLLLFVIVLFYILGCFIDITPILLLLVPLFYPLIVQSGYDPVWFGVVVCALCMIGIVTPPVGTNLFVTKGLVGDEYSISTIMKGNVIFLIPLTLGLIVVMVFPALSTFLPSFMTY